MAVSHEYTALDDPDTPITSAPLGEVVRVQITVMSDRALNYVALRDFLPAGLEPIDPRLAITDPALVAQLEAERRQIAADTNVDYFAPWYFWYYSPWQQVEIRDDHVALFAGTLPKGVHVYTYFARATSVGDYFVAPAHIEETYFPEIFGRSDSSRFEVTP